MSLVRKLIRLFCTPSHRSQVQTGLLPLQDIKSATVFVDENEAGFEPLKLRIKEFFSSRGIEVVFLSAFSKDIRSTSDLFIALNAKPSIDERYAAASSSARFKIGRHALKKGTYDFVVSDPEEVPAPVSEVFDVIEKLLCSVK